MTMLLPTAQGIFILVDDQDFDRAIQHGWSLDPRGYAHAKIEQETVLLHRWLVGAQKGEEVDHKNHNTLDCRRENLRRCTKSQNMANMKTPRSNTTGFKGVTYDKRVNRYTARIKVNQKHLHLGSFLTAEDAGIVYNHAAKQHFGEFALFNEIPDWQSRMPRPAKDVSLRQNNSSGFQGVSYYKKSGKWVAHLRHDGQRIHVGYFPTAEAAAQAREKKARGISR